MMIINSKDNPKIKLFRKLMSGKKARDEYGLFVLEGARLCADAAKESLDGNIEIKYIFISEQANKKYYDLLENSGLRKCVKDDCLFEISDELAEKMSDEGKSQGVFIIAEKLDKEFSVDNILKSGRYIVLDGLQDPGNVGTLLRTADAVGASGVVLTGNCADVYNPKVVRSAMGSMSRINIFVENDFEKVVGLFKNQGIRVSAAVVSGGIFVPQWLLGERVLKVSEFLPAYWYVKANNMLFGINGEIYSDKGFLTYLGIEMLFAVMLFALVMLVFKTKHDAKR